MDQGLLALLLYSLKCYKFIQLVILVAGEHESRDMWRNALGL